jgi:opine dehydrogenase
MNQEMHRQGRGGFGPKTAESRYVLEDVPFGLLPTVLLGRLVERPAALHEAGLALFSAAYGATSRRTTTSCPRSASSASAPPRLQRLARTGYGADS